jgi:four helix bundle protein
MVFNTPPDQTRINVPLIHKLCEFYKKIYLVSSKIPKKDRFGIYSKIENICIDIIILIITAALENKNNKLSLLNSARIKIETLKRLIRIIHELNIIKRKDYIDLEFNLQEISKMTNGWIKYLT